MSKTSNLAQRLKKQKEQESAITQDLMQKQLNTMRSELNGILKSELSTIKADIQSQSQSIGWSMLKSRILWPLVIGLSLCIGILGGSWGVTHYLSNRAMDLNEQIQQGKTTLSQLPKGWTFAKDKQAEYIVLDSKKKPAVDVYQSKGGNWVIMVGK